MPCSNAAKTRNQLKFAGVPHTGQPILAASGPKFTILWRHVDIFILLLNKFFSRFLIHALVEVVRWCTDGDFLRPVFSASRLQHVSDLHPKFARRPHLQRLQSVQNAAGRLVTGARRSDNITPVLRQLHWLPVRQRVAFKIAGLKH